MDLNHENDENILFLKEDHQKQTLRPSSNSSSSSYEPFSSSDDDDEDIEMISTNKIFYKNDNGVSIRNPKNDLTHKKKGVSVFCRVRPQNDKEKKKGGKNIVKVGNDFKSVVVETLDRKLKFQFDRVFDESISQEQVYEEVAKPIIHDVLNGFNCSILAYGQTGSGKTYTTFGPGFEFKKKKEDEKEKKKKRSGRLGGRLSGRLKKTSTLMEERLHFENFVNNEDQWGFIPRLVKDLFFEIENCSLDEEFIVISSFIEIYMEKVRCLLDPRKNNLTILQDLTKGLYITKATEVSVRSWEEVMEVLKLGVKNRFVAETNCNTESSRSHAIFILTIYKRNNITRETKCSQLYLCDLAGSERVSKTKAINVRLDEAKKINASLLSLRQVIFALTENEIRRKKKKKKKKKKLKEQHVPYRNSKLTRILQNSLGGNSYCLMVMNISPSSYNETESISTLRFGERSLHIKNVVKQNKRRTVEELEDLLKKRDQRIEQQTALVRSLQIELKNIRILDRTGGATDKLGRGKNIDLSSFYSFFICPLSRKVMNNPCFAMDGFTYNRDDIIRHLNDPKSKMLSPVSKKRLLSKQIVPNHTIKAQIEYFSEMYPGIFEDFNEYLEYDEHYIPDDILFCIFRFLNASDVITLSKVCSQWYRVSCGENIWKNLYRIKFGDEKMSLEKGQDYREVFWRKFMKKKDRAPWNIPKKKMSGSVYLFRNE